MQNNFNVDVTPDKLTPNTDTSFMMQQLIEQPLNADRPPILYEYDFLTVYELLDDGKDITGYIDYGDMKAMKRTLAQFSKAHKHTGKLLAYKTILETWG